MKLLVSIQYKQHTLEGKSQCLKNHIQRSFGMHRTIDLQCFIYINIHDIHLNRIKFMSGNETESGIHL